MAQHEAHVSRLVRLGATREAVLSDVRLVRFQEQIDDQARLIAEQAEEIATLTKKIVDLREINGKIEQALIREMMKRNKVIAPLPSVDKDGNPVVTKDRWTIIVDQVAEKHGVTAIDIRSARRDWKTCDARNEVFYRMRHETTLSIPKIGRLIGQRDHTTVLSGIHRHEARIASGEAA